jgi:hypothetical protein
MTTREVQELIERMRGRTVRLVGFGAGPGFIAQKTIEFPAPVSLEIALACLGEYSGVLRRARMELDDGVMLGFSRETLLELLAVGVR